MACAESRRRKHSRVEVKRKNDQEFFLFFFFFCVVFFNPFFGRAGPPGDYAYDPYIYNLSSCQSVSTLILNDTIANDQPFVISTIAEADGIFIAGGDQSQYYNIWGNFQNGSITKAINQRAKQG